MSRLGAVTIGQSPRTDIIPDLRTVLGAEVEIGAARAACVLERLVFALPGAVAGDGHVGVITPDPGQVEEQRARWSEVVHRVTVLSASPYADAAALPAPGPQLANAG